MGTNTECQTIALYIKQAEQRLGDSMRDQTGVGFLLGGRLGGVRCGGQGSVCLVDRGEAAAERAGQYLDLLSRPTQPPTAFVCSTLRHFDSPSFLPSTLVTAVC